MSEEKIKILDMLRDGKITTEEAMALLKQVQDEDDRPSRYIRQNWDQWVPHRPYKQDFGWIDDLRATIEDMTSDIGETAHNVIFPTDFIFGSRKETFKASSQSIDGDIRALVFEGKNAPVKLDDYGGDKIKVEAYYKAKGNGDPHIALTEENGVFSLRYDDNALYMLGINVHVPEEAHIGSVRLKNRNASVSVDDIEAEKIELSTKNDSIKISDTKGEYLYCDTKNAPIILDEVEMREIDAQTSHAKISLEDVTAFRARLMTSCARIDVEDSNIVQLYAKTSDSPLRFENLGCVEQESVCSVDAITSNGQISIEIPHDDLKCRLHASTTNGGVFNELEDLEYQVNEKNYAEAQSRGYDAAKNKLNLNLRTTNSGIYIKR